MMQPDTMISSRVSYRADTHPQGRIVDVSRGDVGVIVQRWRCGLRKKYLVKFLRNPDELVWALPGTIRRLA